MDALAALHGLAEVLLDLLERVTEGALLQLLRDVMLLCSILLMGHSGAVTTLDT